ncbi:MAG TPA: hypothetical protein VM056_00435 [Terriglobales bacterium]|nr:hypothetical protein [Terriglobales bacterium]
MSETKKTQRRADRMHAILKASRPDRQVDRDLAEFMREEPQVFQTKPCIRKPEDAVACRSVGFHFQNDWPYRLRISPRKAFSGVMVVADDRVVAQSLGFGQFPDEIIVFRENGKFSYFPKISDDSPLFKSTMQPYFVTAADSDEDRSRALDWDNSFLTDLRTIKNANELLKSSPR